MQSSKKSNSMTLEQALAKLLKTVKKSKGNEVVKNVVPDLFDLLSSVKSVEVSISFCFRVYLLTVCRLGL